MAVDVLTSLRERLLPMLEVVAAEYRHRTPHGYPLIIDEPQRGAVGLLLDASHSIHLTSDGQAVFAEIAAQSARNDARSSASREKFAGLPFNDRRQISADITDQELRNLIAELVSRWNMQPNLIHITDT